MLANQPPTLLDLGDGVLECIFDLALHGPEPDEDRQLWRRTCRLTCRRCCTIIDTCTLFNARLTLHSLVICPEASSIALAAASRAMAQLACGPLQAGWATIEEAAASLRRRVPMLRSLRVACSEDDPAELDRLLEEAASGQHLQALDLPAQLLPRINTPQLFRFSPALRELTVFDDPSLVGAHGSPVPIDALRPLTACTKLSRLLLSGRLRGGHCR